MRGRKRAKDFKFKLHKKQLVHFLTKEKTSHQEDLSKKENIIIFPVYNYQRESVIEILTIN